LRLLTLLQGRSSWECEKIAGDSGLSKHTSIAEATRSSSTLYPCSKRQHLIHPTVNELFDLNLDLLVDPTQMFEVSIRIPTPSMEDEEKIVAESKHALTLDHQY
jgi:hypothetical protein